MAAAAAPALPTGGGKQGSVCRGGPFSLGGSGHQSSAPRFPLIQAGSPCSASTAPRSPESERRRQVASEIHSYYRDRDIAHEQAASSPGLPATTELVYLPQAVGTLAALPVDTPSQSTEGDSVPGELFRSWRPERWVHSRGLTAGFSCLRPQAVTRGAPLRLAGRLQSPGWAPLKMRKRRSRPQAAAAASRPSSMRIRGRCSCSWKSGTGTSSASRRSCRRDEGPRRRCSGAC